MPRNPSSVIVPASRSCMCTSHGSKPALYIADVISRSPLLPSSRIIATLYLERSASHSAGVSRGSNVSSHLGAWRVFIACCSCSTHSGLHCSFSSSNDVAIHRPRSVVIGCDSTSCSPKRTVTLSAAVVRPITTHGTSAAAYAAFTSSTFASSTSITRPSSSLNSVSSTRASAGNVSSAPHTPPKHISSTVVIRPPSERSWPASSRRSRSSFCVTRNARFSTAVSVSGHESPTCLNVCASAEPPRCWLPSPRSTNSSVERPGCFRSGVTVSDTSGHAAYTDTTSVPGAFTSSLPTFAAIDSESLPPSTATPSSIIALPIASQQSYIAAPSPSSLLAHIQLPLHFTSSMSVIAAHTRFVHASPTVRRPIADGLIRPFTGCSPMAVAQPVLLKCDCANTATSDSGRCSGPQHDCRAIRPVTERSTLFVRKLLLPTLSRRSTRSSAPITVRSAGSSSGFSTCGTWWS